MYYNKGLGCTGVNFVDVTGMMTHYGVSTSCPRPLDCLYSGIEVTITSNVGEDGA
jgi:hypothetical protein